MKTNFSPADIDLEFVTRAYSGVSFFPEKRARLKSHGFKWAPSQNAWQRQLTKAARLAVRKIFR